MRFLKGIIKFLTRLSLVVLFWGGLSIGIWIFLWQNAQSANRYGERCLNTLPNELTSILNQLELESYHTSMNCNTVVIEAQVAPEYSVRQYQAIAIKLSMLTAQSNIQQPIELILNGDFQAFARVAEGQGVLFLAHQSSQTAK